MQKAQKTGAARGRVNTFVAAIVVMGAAIGASSAVRAEPAGGYG